MDSWYIGCDGTSEWVVAILGIPKLRKSMIGAIRKQLSSRKQTSWPDQSTAGSESMRAFAYTIAALMNHDEPTSKWQVVDTSY